MAGCWGGHSRKQEAHNGFCAATAPRASTSRVMEMIRVCMPWTSSVGWRTAAAGPSLPKSWMVKVIRCCKRCSSNRHAASRVRHWCRAPSSVVKGYVWDPTVVVAGSFLLHVWSGGWAAISGLLSLPMATDPLDLAGAPSYGATPMSPLGVKVHELPPLENSAFCLAFAKL